MTILSIEVATVISDALSGKVPERNPIWVLATAIAVVESSDVAGSGNWPYALRKAKRALMVLEADANTEFAQAQAWANYSYWQSLAARAVAKESKRETRHQANLRHAQNKAQRAEKNRSMAKDFGSGTKKK